MRWLNCDVPIMSRNVLEREKGINSHLLEMLEGKIGNYNGEMERKWKFPKVRWLPWVSFVKNTKTWQSPHYSPGEVFDTLPLERGRGLCASKMLSFSGLQMKTYMKSCMLKNCSSRIKTARPKKFWYVKWLMYIVENEKLSVKCLWLCRMHNVGCWKL